MKNLSLLRLGTLFSLMAILFISCSKDARNKGLANPGNLTGNLNPSDIKTGIILAATSWQGQNIYMIAYNDSYTSDPVYANEFGVMEMKEVPEGFYTVRFHVEPDGSATREFEDIILEEVLVNPWEVTDLGVIEF